MQPGSTGSEDLSKATERPAPDRLQARRCTAARYYMKHAYFTAQGLVGNYADALDLSQVALANTNRTIP